LNTSNCCQSLTTFQVVSAHHCFSAENSLAGDIHAQERTLLLYMNQGLYVHTPKITLPLKLWPFSALQNNIDVSVIQGRM